MKQETSGHSNGPKIKFVMTKTDMFNNEDDKIKCVCQITQELSSFITPEHGFEMPVIYIPDKANQGQINMPLNQINKLVEEIED